MGVMRLKGEALFHVRNNAGIHRRVFRSVEVWERVQRTGPAWAARSGRSYGTVCGGAT
jgi:hypothetical protein